MGSLFCEVFLCLFSGRLGSEDLETDYGFVILSVGREVKLGLWINSNSVVFLKFCF